MWRSIGLIWALVLRRLRLSQILGDSYDSKTSPLVFLCLKAITNNYVLCWVYSWYRKLILSKAAMFFCKSKLYNRKMFFVLFHLFWNVVELLFEFLWFVWSPVNLLSEVGTGKTKISDEARPDIDATPRPLRPAIRTVCRCSRTIAARSSPGVARILETRFSSSAVISLAASTILDCYSKCCARVACVRLMRGAAARTGRAIARPRGG